MARTHADTLHYLDVAGRKWLTPALHGLCLERFHRGLVAYGPENHLSASFEQRREHLEEAADCFVFSVIGYVRGDYDHMDLNSLAYHASEIMRIISGTPAAAWDDDDDLWGV